MATNQAKRCQVSGLINNFFKQITQREHDSRRDTDLKLYNLRQDQAVIIAAEITPKLSSMQILQAVTTMATPTLQLF